MKDYPEAQEILQTLGRKRLQEAKNMSKKCKGKTSNIHFNQISEDFQLHIRSSLKV